MIVSPGHARGASIPLHKFEKLPSLSSAAASRRCSTGASGGSLFLYPETNAQGVWLVGPGPVSETRPLLPMEMERRTTAGGGLLIAWRFAFSVLGDSHTSCMTCGPGPPCQRLGRFGARRARWARAGESPLKRDSPRVQQLRFRILSSCCALSPSSFLRPFAFTLSCSTPAPPPTP
jgi:hypothetical protein